MATDAKMKILTCENVDNGFPPCEVLIKSQETIDRLNRRIEELEFRIDRIRASVTRIATEENTTIEG